MKRRPSAPLCQQIEPDVYVIDTSVWSNIDKRSDAEDVWRLIVDLINEERIVVCATVLIEMEDEDFYLPRLFPHEAALKAGDRSGTDYLLHVGKVTREHPAMAGATGMKNKADPYVIALAELERYAVVADESCRKRPNRRIPGCMPAAWHQVQDSRGIRKRGASSNRFSGDYGRGGLNLHGACAPPNS